MRAKPIREGFEAGGNVTKLEGRYKVPSFHSTGKLKGNKNVFVGRYGASCNIVNKACNTPMILMKARTYQVYKNDNFIWLSNDDGYHRSSPDMGRRNRKERLIQYKRGGFLFHLPTNNYIKVNHPPESLGDGKFNTGNKIIEWQGSNFKEIKKSEDKSESRIRYETEESFSGELETTKPVTDMRELDHVKWDLYVDNVVEKVPFIRTKEEAKKWLSGKEQYGPPMEDMRDSLQKHLDKDEFELIKENL